MSLRRRLGRGDDLDALLAQLAERGPPRVDPLLDVLVRLDGPGVVGEALGNIRADAAGIDPQGALPGVGDDDVLGLATEQHRSERHLGDDERAAFGFAVLGVAAHHLRRRLA